MRARYPIEEIAAQLKTNSMFFWASALAAIAASLFAWSVLVGPGYGLPAHDRLVSSSGYLISHKWGYRSYTIRLRMDKDPREFVYTEKMGDKLGVWKRLCDGCRIAIWSDPNDQRSSPFAFQIAVDDQIIRSYGDVKATWLADGARSLMFMLVSGLISCLFLGFGLFRGRSRQRISS